MSFLEKLKVFLLVLTLIAIIFLAALFGGTS